MDFIEFSQLLFGNQLLASEGTVKDVLAKYELAIQNGHEYVGLIKRDKAPHTKLESRVYKGSDGKMLGILPIKGALVYEETGWEALCGMTSYEGLQAKAEHMIKERKIEKLILEINSGGGMAYGCFETAQYVKNLATEHNVPIEAYVDGVAFSGGYAWCAIADKIVVNPMGKVGSIGVVLPLVNTSQRDKKEGVERIYITAGKSKVPYDKDGNFTKEALDDIQSDVMVTYKMFVDHVAANRNLSAEAVENTEAKTFGTEKGLALGLIDAVMTKEQFYQHLGNFNGDYTMAQTIANANTDTQVTSDATQSKVMEQLSNTITAHEATIAGHVTSIATLTGARDQAVSDLGVANIKITDLEKQIAELTAANTKVTNDARKARISAFVAADDVAEHMDMVSGFDDAKFDKYVGNLEKTHEKVAGSFAEVGVDAGEKSTQEQLSVGQKMVQNMKAKRGEV